MYLLHIQTSQDTRKSVISGVESHPYKRDDDSKLVRGVIYKVSIMHDIDYNTYNSERTRTSLSPLSLFLHSDLTHAKVITTV